MFDRPLGARAICRVGSSKLVHALGTARSTQQTYYLPMLRGGTREILMLEAYVLGVPVTGSCLLRRPSPRVGGGCSGLGRYLGRSFGLLLVRTCTCFTRRPLCLIV